MTREKGFNWVINRGWDTEERIKYAQRDTFFFFFRKHNFILKFVQNATGCEMAAHQLYSVGCFPLSKNVFIFGEIPRSKREVKILIKI